MQLGLSNGNQKVGESISTPAISMGSSRSNNSSSSSSRGLSSQSISYSHRVSPTAALAGESTITALRAALAATSVATSS